MKMIGINEISRLTDIEEKTVSARLAGIQPTAGPNRSKLYDSEIALKKVFELEPLNPGDPITQERAQMQLTIARTKEIKLRMIETRKQWIPVDSVNEINLQVEGAIMEVINASPLPPDAKADIQQLLREIPAKLK